MSFHLLLIVLYLSGLPHDDLGFASYNSNPRVEASNKSLHLVFDPSLPHIITWFIGKTSWIVRASFEREGEWVLSWRNKASSEIIQYMWESRDNSSSWVSLYFDDVVSPFDIIKLHGLVFTSIIGGVRTFHMYSIGIVPDKVILYVLPLCFQEDSFFDPPHWLPPFELYNDLVGVDGLYQIEEDVSLDGVACEVERLIN